MQRITIISSIIAAVCVFQTAGAGLFDKLPANPISKLLENQVNGQITKSNPIKTCMDAYNDGSNIIHQVKTIFSTCCSDKINGTNTDIQHVNDALDELKANIAKVYEEVTKCKDITTIKQCLSNVYQENVEGLKSSLNKVKNAATEVMHITSEIIKKFYQTTKHELPKENVESFVKNGTQCVKYIEKLKNETSQKTFPIPAACTDLFNKMQEVVNQMSNSFHEYHFNKTSVSPDMEELNNIVNNMERELLNIFEDAIKCVQRPSIIMSCLTEVLQKKAPELDSLFENAILAIPHLVGVITNMGECFDIAIHVLCHNVSNLVNGMIQCVQSVFPS